MKLYRSLGERAALGLLWACLAVLAVMMVLVPILYWR